MYSKNISILSIFFLLCIVLSAEGLLSMAPNITETIFYLGMDSMLAGRTAFCNYPENAADIPVAGSFISMNFESVIQLNPDIVIFSDNLTPREETFLMQNGIGYVDIVMNDLESVFQGMDQLALLTGAAADIDSFMHEATQLINQYRADSNTLKIYIEVGSSPIVAAGRESYLGSILEAMNYNVIDFGGDYLPVSQEDIINSDPDIIIIMSGAANPVERSGWEYMNAVENGNVIILTEHEVDIMSRPGPRIIDAITLIGEYLYEIDI